MLTRLSRLFRLRRRPTYQHEIAPEDIFLDAHNLPEFNQNQFEGKIERPISRVSLMIVATFAVLILTIFAGRLWALQVVDGEQYRDRSENNRLNYSILFADRGVIYDRTGLPLAWNTVDADQTRDFALRTYASLEGISSLVGFVKYPTKDTSGFYFEENYVGKTGVERVYNSLLRGTNGKMLLETDVHGDVVSQGFMEPAAHGNAITLSINAALQQQLFQEIKTVADAVPFVGGAAIIMDLSNGEVLANVTYPEYNAQVLTDGTDLATIQRYNGDPRNPFLNRITDGMYAPASTIKTIVALAALNEKTISPQKTIVSTGSISIPNPYFPDKPSVYRDWKAHGAVDMRRALAVSSDVYFYVVGGGFEGQKGLGIAKLDAYFSKFGFNKAITTPFFETAVGVIPTPDWKQKTFNEPWVLGNTYHSAIGQYGFQITPLHLLNMTSYIALNGRAPEPTVIKQASGEPVEQVVVEGISPESYAIVQEGMRLAVTEGTAGPLNVGYTTIAAKTGTAELGSQNQFVHSWVVGYFPYDKPRYAFVLLLDKGPRTNTISASSILRKVFDWAHTNNVIDFSS